MSGQGEWFLEYMKIFLGKTSHSWAMQVLTGQRQVIPGQGELFLGKRGGGAALLHVCFRLHVSGCGPWQLSLLLFHGQGNACSHPCWERMRLTGPPKPGDVGIQETTSIGVTARTWLHRTWQPMHCFMPCSHNTTPQCTLRIFTHSYTHPSHMHDAFESVAAAPHMQPSLHVTKPLSVHAIYIIYALHLELSRVPHPHPKHTPLQPDGYIKAGQCPDGGLEDCGAPRVVA